MNRFVAILLIPFLLVGNALAHSHGTTAHQSPNHGRAHIHIGSAPHHGHHSHETEGHHHEHDHESDEPESAPVVTPVEHDSDAIYVVSADDAYTPTDRVSTVLVLSYFDTPLCILNDSCPPVPRSCTLCANTSELPLFLLHAALRL